MEINLLVFGGQLSNKRVGLHLWTDLYRQGSLEEQNKGMAGRGRPGRGLTPTEYQTASLTCGRKGESMCVLDAPPEAV